MSKGEKSLKTVLLSLFIGSNLLFGAGYITVFFRSKKNFLLAERALQKENITKAVLLYNRAIRWYTPKNPYIAASIQRLKQIAQFTYLRGNWDRAVSIYQECYSSLVSTRGLFISEKAAKSLLSDLTDKLSELPPPTQGEYRQKEFKMKLMKLFSPPKKEGKKALILFFIVILGLSVIMLDHNSIFQRGERR